MNKDFSIGEAIKAGWEATKSHLGILIVIQIVFILVGYVPLIGGELLIPKARWVGVLLLLSGYALQLIMLLGIVKISVKLADKEPIAVGDMFAQAGRLFPFVVATLIFDLAIVLGTVLLVIPGVIVFLGLCFYSFPLVDKKAGMVDALKQSWALTKGVKLKILGFLIVVSLVNMLGVLLLLIGMFVTVPVTYVAFAHVYRKLSEQTQTT